MSEERKVLQLSRKDFLKGTGASVAGLVLMGGLSTLVTGCATQNAPAAGEIAVPEWPYKYAKLDADKAAQKAYEGYKEGG
jgi:hypothetical protein